MIDSILPPIPIITVKLSCYFVTQGQACLPEEGTVHGEQSPSKWMLSSQWWRTSDWH